MLDAPIAPAAKAPLAALTVVGLQALHGVPDVVSKVGDIEFINRDVWSGRMESE